LHNSSIFYFVNSTATNRFYRRQTSEGKSIGSYIDSSQIYKANKQEHFQKLKREYKSIEYSEMLFFDNEMGNIRSVSKLGVKCIYCPDGMTQAIWDEGLKKFE
jgi:magnesium-dependent phosphatase 1